MKKLLLLVCLLALPSLAYEYKPNQWLMRGVMGKSIYFAQDSTTGINYNIVTGVEVNYLLSKKWAVLADFKPTFAVNRVVLSFGAGAKHRFYTKDIPLIPFFSASIVPSILIPTNGLSNSHFNLGLRPAGGFEYFIARDLVLGVELGVTPSLLFGKGTSNTFEATFDMLASATWRL